jgi:hypothetical protein
MRKSVVNFFFAAAAAQVVFAVNIVKARITTFGKTMTLAAKSIFFIAKPPLVFFLQN